MDKKMPTTPNCLYEKEIFKSKSMFMFVLHCRSMLHFSHCVSPWDSARMRVFKRLCCMSASCSADHRRPPASTGSVFQAQHGAAPPDGWSHGTHEGSAIPLHSLPGNCSLRLRRLHISLTCSKETL